MCEAIVYGSWSGARCCTTGQASAQAQHARRGSRRNIHAHYDLGNEFYRLWLDPSMSYSAAWFEGRPEQHTLAERPTGQDAPRAAPGRRAPPASRVLEIGCGWGALAQTAARASSAPQVTGVTLSREQLAWAQTSIARGTKLARAIRSICACRTTAICRPSMPTRPSMRSSRSRCSKPSAANTGSGYFEVLKRCLKPGGRACIQTITIRDDLFDRYVKSTDFIQQYIFPGGLLPSPSAARGTGARGRLRGREPPGLRPRLRRRRCAAGATISCANEARLPQHGFDERFMRIWEFYLAYCEAAFDMGNPTDVMQFTLRRASLRVTLVALVALALLSFIASAQADPTESPAMPASSAARSSLNSAACREWPTRSPRPGVIGPGQPALLRPAGLRRAPVGLAMRPQARGL